MKIVIDIPKEMYNDIKSGKDGYSNYVHTAVRNGTPLPKTGYWIYDDECHEHGHCSECGYGRVDLVNGEPHNFCRRCGARMESEDDI